MRLAVKDHSDHASDDGFHRHEHRGTGRLQFLEPPRIEEIRQDGGNDGDADAPYPQRRIGGEHLEDRADVRHGERSYERENEGVSRDRHRVVLPEPEGAEDRIEGVKEPRRYAHERHEGLQLISATRHARDEETTDEGQGKGNDLVGVHLLLEKERGEYHHEDGRRIKQNDGDGRLRMDDGIEIAIIEKSDADDARAEKYPDVTQAKSELSREDGGSRKEENRRRDEETHEAYLHGCEPCRRQLLDEDPDDSPQYARQEHRENGKRRLFHQIHYTATFPKTQFFNGESLHYFSRCDMISLVGGLHPRKTNTLP